MVISLYSREERILKRREVIQIKLAERPSCMKAESYKSTLCIGAIGGEWEQFLGQNGNEMVYYQMLLQTVETETFLDISCNEKQRFEFIGEYKITEGRMLTIF